MKLSVNEVLDKVDEIQDADRDYAALARRWENIYFGKAFDSESERKLIEDGQEVVVTKDPYDTVNLAMRLVSGDPKIIVPPKEEEEQSVQYATARERWLTAMWQQQAKHRGKNLIDSGAWQSFVLARHAYDVKWIKDSLPTKLQKSLFPISIRPLRPTNVGVARGESFTEYAFHQYETKLWEVLQRYPELKRRKSIAERRTRDESYRFETVTITDFWYVDLNEGDIWNCVLLDKDDFIKPPAKTKYPKIPIVVGLADTTEAENPAYESLSLMFSMDGPWQAKCKQMSMELTGMLQYFWPYVYVTNELGQIVPDITARPREIDHLPEGTKINVLSVQPNMQLSQALASQFENALQKAGFPTVMYGNAPGDLQSGYGVNMLADAARGRIRSPLQNLESTIEELNALALGLVEAFAGKDGVDVWGMNQSKKPYRMALTKEMIEGGYTENHVILKPQLPENDIQRLTLGLQLFQAGIISAETYRELWLQLDLPEDEQNRVYREQAMNTPELLPKRHMLALTAFYGREKAEMYARNTPLQDVLNPPPPAPPQGPPQGPPPGMPPMGPEGMMPPDMGMGGMPPMGPPQGPPPEMGMPPVPTDAMMGAGGTGVPMGPGGMADLQGQMPPTPLGGGIPPELVGGQITPEMLDLLRQGDPMTYQALVNGGMTDMEIQNLLMGLGG